MILYSSLTVLHLRSIIVMHDMEEEEDRMNDRTKIL